MTPEQYQVAPLTNLSAEGAEIRVYHPSQERAIVDAAHDAVTILVARHPVSARYTTGSPHDDSIIYLRHPLLRLDTFHECSPDVERPKNLDRIYRLLGNVEDSSLQVWIEPQQLAGWLTQWEHHLKIAAVRHSHLERSDAQEYLYKKLVAACYYC